MIPYILHVGLLISVCLFFYRLLLSKETFYRLNRFVLISSLALSFLIPLVPVPQQLTFRTIQEPVSINLPVANVSTPINNESKKSTSSEQQKITAVPATDVAPVINQAPLSQRVLKWVFYLYWVGAVVFALNFILQLVVLLYRSYSRPVIQDGRFRIVELEGDKAPCSFGNTIFINPAKYDWETYNQVLLHEKIHIQQGHSFDILLAELVIVFQWFNPFAWLYRKELENNLEFLTDNSVLHKDGIEKERYQLSLLQVSAPHYSLGLTTNYNQSLLKKRIAMMNAKKSNLHTMWKYFFLVPLIGCLMAAFNDTVALGQTGNKNNNTDEARRKTNSNIDRSSGAWFATIKNDRLRIQFQDDEDKDGWNSNSDFLISEFSALPKDNAGEFTLTRDAGTILFKGKFDGNKGYGDYKFTANKDFFNNIAKAGITGVTEEENFAFFLINIKQDYVKMLHESGYKNIDKEDLIAMAALKIDAPFIEGWKQYGFSDISMENLIATKSLGIDKAYIDEIKKAGYKNITVEELISFKAQNISGDYINGLKKNKPSSQEGKEELPEVSDITSFKALDIDAAFIKSFEDIGYKNIPHSELTALKSLQVTPEFIKSFISAGLKNIPIGEAIGMKSLNVTPEFIKSFTTMGYTFSQDDILAAKSLGVTPEYIKSFQALGYTKGDIGDFIPLKSLGITPEYVNGFKKLGFSDIDLDDLPALKSMNVTPEFIKSMQEKGIKLSSPQKYIQLKATMEQ
jgi:beta-lactamase regulating signal transducer with metallopeptidase domain